MRRMEQDDYEVLGAGRDTRPIKMWTRGVPVEPEAKEQLSKLAQLPFV
ncbi:RtcB family protein, partial [Acinetobacter baumannii]|nr:RtcB family protein [Acinetobacter baumannii]